MCVCEVGRHTVHTHTDHMTAVTHTRKQFIEPVTVMDRPSQAQACLTVQCQGIALSRPSPPRSPCLDNYYWNCNPRGAASPLSFHHRMKAEHFLA